MYLSLKLEQGLIPGLTLKTFVSSSTMSFVIILKDLREYTTSKSNEVVIEILLNLVDHDKRVKKSIFFTWSI